MNEVRLFGVLLTALLVAAYMSWTRPDDDGVVEKNDVVVWDVAPDRLQRVTYVTPTQTVSVSRIEALGGRERYPLFEIQRRNKKTIFVGSDQAKELLTRFAPLKALRSLGPSSPTTTSRKPD